MTTTELDQLYDQQIKPLSCAARLQLLARIAHDLAVVDEAPGARSIMELHGLGAEIPAGHRRAAVRQRAARRVGSVVMKLDDALVGVNRLGLDTPPLTF